jgi:SAM-dependent methyltransferase
MINIKNIKSYEDYVQLQKEKTEDPVRRKRWESALRENTRRFIPTFQKFITEIEQFKHDKVYCLGARTGEEALALRALGFKNALGTDLVPFMNHVIEDDLHNMQFENNSVGLFYTNIFDHCLKPGVMMSEVNRCLKPGGRAFFQLQIGSNLDKYGVLFIDDIKDFERLAVDRGLDVHLSQRNTILSPHNHGLNWDVILEKKK